MRSRANGFQDAEGAQGDPLAGLAPLLDVDPHLTVERVLQLPAPLAVLFRENELDGVGQARVVRQGGWPRPASTSSASRISLV